MIQVSYKREQEQVNSLPKDVQNNIKETLQVLDIEYGANRNKYEDNGGYVVVVEVKEDFRVLKNRTYIDCDTAIPEFVEKILCSNGEVYTNSLILCNNDYAISIIIPLELTPQNLKDYMID